jgi:hypothetical protein
VAAHQSSRYAIPVDNFSSRARRASREWGTTAEERALQFPCDALAVEGDAALFRGVSVNAPTTTVFRWLCQLRVAPYSYDWIDNRGRRSPPHLTTGLQHLSRGQEFMGIFTLVDFETDRHVTLQIKKPSAAEKAFGNIRGTYLLAAAGHGCRLLVKLLAAFPPGLVGAGARHLLPWGDLMMMRRQLLNLKSLAERST